jgi:hypothetical protein
MAFATDCLEKSQRPMAALWQEISARNMPNNPWPFCSRSTHNISISPARRYHTWQGNVGKASAIQLEMPRAAQEPHKSRTRAAFKATCTGPYRCAHMLLSSTVRRSTPWHVCAWLAQCLPNSERLHSTRTAESVRRHFFLPRIIYKAHLVNVTILTLCQNYELARLLVHG